MKNASNVASLCDFRQKRAASAAKDRSKRSNKDDAAIAADPRAGDRERMLADKRIKARECMEKMAKEIEESPEMMAEAAWRMTNIHRPANEQLSYEQWKARTGYESQGASK